MWSPIEEQVEIYDDETKPDQGNIQGNITDRELLKFQRRFVFKQDQHFEPVKREEVVGLNYVFEELDLFIRMLHLVADFSGNEDIEIDTGVLFKGPPGVGKSFCAQYLATEANARIIRVPEFPRRTAKGLGAEDVSALFSLAREYVQKEKRPILLFWDEFDAFVNGESEERLATVAQLNEELSGLKGRPHGVFLIVASNKSHLIPKDLLRDGRIGIHINISFPTKSAKRKLLEHFVTKKKVAKIDYDSLVFLLQHSMTPIAIRKIVEKAWQIAKVRAITNDEECILTEEDLAKVLLRRLRGAPRDITLSNENHLHHARNVVARALVGRTLGAPFQLIALSKHGYNYPLVISEFDESEGIRNLSNEESLITVEFATLVADEMFGYESSGLTSNAKEFATALALELVESHGITKAVENAVGKNEVPRRLVSIPTVSKWREEHKLPPMFGVHDEHHNNYELVKQLLDRHLKRAREILSHYGTSVIDEIAQRLIAPEGSCYLTQKSLDEYVDAEFEPEPIRPKPKKAVGFDS